MGLGVLMLPLALSGAQEAEPAGGAAVPDAEIVVTGERVPRSLRETASSVAVVTADDIESAGGADRVEDVLALVPNLQLASGGEGPTIRGQDTTGAMRDLPSFLGGNRPRTTLIVDGRSVSFNEFVFGIAPLWDVERIEVYRTPQTTTQGRNSIAGAIFVHSQDPTDRPEARARAIVGDLGARQLSATASAPVLDDSLAVRVSGDWRRARPSSRIGDNMRGADPNRDEYGMARVKLLARPSALPDSRFELTYAHSQSQMPQFEGIQPPFRERRNPSARYGIFRTNVDSVTLAADVRVSSALTNRSVVSFGDAFARRFAPPGLGEARNHVRDWSGETVFDWAASPELRTTFGLSALRTTLDQHIDLSQLSGDGNFDDTQSSFGLFGEMRWTAWPGAELVAGLRYQRDSQQRAGGLATQGGNIPFDYDRTFSAWLPKASFSVALDKSLVAGVLVQRAYNPGGATLRFDTGMRDEIEAESLWNFELFARASLAPRLEARVNAFRTDIRNAQRSRPLPLLAPSGSTVIFADLFNVARARTGGAEIELDWRPSPGLSAKAGVGPLTTRITDPGDAPGDLDGNDFQRSPSLTAALAVDWRPLDRLRLSAQLRRNGGYFSDDANTPGFRIAPSTMVNARGAWTSGRITLFGYVRNLFDEFSLTYFSNANLATAADPREAGVGLEAAF